MLRNAKAEFTDLDKSTNPIIWIYTIEDMSVHTIALKLDNHEYKKLKARAQRAALPLEIYIVAAASDPLKYAWAENDKTTVAEVNI